MSSQHEVDAIIATHTWVSGICSACGCRKGTFPTYWTCEGDPEPWFDHEVWTTEFNRMQRDLG